MIRCWVTLWLIMTPSAALWAQSKQQAAMAEAQRGVEAARAEHFDQAVAAYQRALVLDPDLPNLHLNLGLAWFKSGHFREAISALEEERRRASNAQVDTLLAMSYFGLREYKQAATRLKPVADADPQNSELAYLLAKCYLWSNDYQSAMAVFRQLLAQDADVPAVHMLLGEALDADGRTPEAVAEFERAAKLQPKQPDVHFGLGYLYWKEKKYGEAKDEFKRELSNDPKQALAMSYLADTLLREGQPDAAFPLLKEAAALRPDLAVIQTDLGTIYTAQNKSLFAVQAFQNAIKLDEGNYDAHYRLGRLYQQLGRKAEADREFATVRRLHETRDQPPLMRVNGPQ